mmetsp:Transcript_34111/g.73931  ORF Transcript_34111/g.73931 Transcript_34111/m.73931 type:complete len:371 (+) Transcript_34111:261-1373(+)
MPICTWPVAAVFLVCFVATMILLLIFAPIEQGVAGAMPNFEPNQDQLEWIINSNRPPTSAPTSVAVGTTPSEQYQFIQCNPSEECCNGNPLNCDLRLNEMSFATVHNAMSTKESSNSLGYNHLFDLDGALLAGYRGLNLDVCKCGGRIRFCHNFCDFGDRDAAQVLLEVMKFLMNPEHLSEIVVLIFQFSTGEATADELYEVMQDVDGFTDLMYVHNAADPGAEWPLMRDLLNQDQPKRIVVFQHDGPDCSVAGSCPAGIHDYFDYTAETPFEFSSVDNMRNVETSCVINRGPKEGAAFYGVNTFVTPPNVDTAAVVNSLTFVKRRLNRCSRASGLIPNFITVDFWSIGDVPEIAQRRNIALAQMMRRER